MPFTRVEVAVMSLVEGRLQVLLARRAQAPYAGRWALPGGVLRIDVDRTLEAAAQRVAQERLGVALPFLRQLCAVGGPTRDPRGAQGPLGAWALSVVYRALVPLEQVPASPGKRVEALAWRPVEEAAADASLAFDHAALVGQAAEATRVEVEGLALPAGFLPPTFTLGELQATCEQLLGHRLDKSSFRRKLDTRELVEPVEGEMRGGAYRPAQVFRLRAT
jgi:ADP-ribose pyrophosphatase YjhB (NUDIX family)